MIMIPSIFSRRATSDLARHLMTWTTIPIFSGRWAEAFSNRGCCLTFHRVAHQSEWAAKPNRGFYIDLTFLEGIIIHLLRNNWDIVTLSEALRRMNTPEHGRRFVNFSIDDCYCDTAELVVPLFRRHSVPVTLFVTTGIPDKLFPLRDAGLETILERETQCSDGGVTFSLETIEEKRAAYSEITGRWDKAADPDRLYAQLCARLGYNPDTLDERHRITWSMLEALANDPVVEIGGHTVRHKRVAALDEEGAMAELVGCRERLETKLGIPIEHFAFPYGRSKDCGDRDFHLAEQAGFRSAATTRKGLVSHDSDPFRLARNTLNGNQRWLPFTYAHLTGLSGYVAQVTGRG